MPKISVIVPFYNEENYIENCIKSLLNQESGTPDYEIIFVNSNSLDDSNKIAESYLINILQATKKGSYVARNLGIQSTASDIIAFTDADCIPQPDWLKTISLTLQNPEIQIVLGKRITTYSKNSCLGLLDEYEHQKAEYVFNSGKPDIFFGYTNNMAVRRTIFEELGLFKEIERGADTIFVNQAARKYSPMVICYDPKIRVFHQEIKNSFDYFKKVSIYGFSSSSHQKQFLTPLSATERWYVYQKASQKHSFVNKLMLLFLLCIGILSWIYGQSRSRSTALKPWY